MGLFLGTLIRHCLFLRLEGFLCMVADMVAAGAGADLELVAEMGTSDALI